ncbi:MAG: dTDP-4-dehydrorhamnose 3,5-epimerase family protein [Patescibacteria group bacterium]
MKILEVKNLTIPDVKVIRFGKFSDQRGYFTETFRKSDVSKLSLLDFLKSYEFVQMNESYAVKGVIKGLHFQWQPPMGKLVRMVRGHMVDMILDIHQASPTFGRIILYDMPDHAKDDYGEWIWVPPGFAHGMFFTEDSVIEYFFTADYNPAAEAGISPLTEDLDWSLCDPALKQKFEESAKSRVILSERDEKGFSLKAWVQDPRSNNF